MEERLKRLELAVSCIETALRGALNSDLKVLITAMQANAGNREQISENIDDLEKLHQRIVSLLDDAEKLTDDDVSTRLLEDQSDE